MIATNQGEVIEKASRTPTKKLEQRNTIKAAQTKPTGLNEKEKSHEKSAKVYRIPLYRNMIKETVPI